MGKGQPGKCGQQIDMKLIFASDSFKGTLESARIAELLERAARAVFGKVETVNIALADGGEGTVDAVLASSDAKARAALVHGPLMDHAEAKYAIFDDGRAVIEMASASGITLIPEDRKDPLEATSYGTGELLAAALDAGARDITIGIGGSATNDGGMGFMRALGAAFYDAEGELLEGRGRDLIRVARIDLAGLDSRLADTRITVMCDVDNPLTGEAGATYVYAPQKGASGEALELLERGMQNYRDVIADLTGINCDEVPGAGAAGGIGAALYALLGADIRPGIGIMLDLTGFDDALDGADLVITGEGRADFQSMHGKVLHGIGRRAKEKNVPVTAIVGGLGEGWEGLLNCGIGKVIPLVQGGVTLEDAINRAEEVYYDAALSYFSSVKDKHDRHPEKKFCWT